MPNFINTIDLLGDEAVAKSFLDRTIKEFNDDVITRIGNNAFARCNQLESVNLPNLNVIDERAFYDCSLSSIVLQKVATIAKEAFFMCSKLEKFDLLNTVAFQSMTFYKCTKLTTLILRGDGVCPLQSINAFANTPFASGGTGGTVYVHQEFITEYQNATNWSTLYAGGTCNFVAIEGSEYE